MAEWLFLPSAALLQPDGQRLCVQADQQLHQLLHAWRPKGKLRVCDPKQSWDLMGNIILCFTRVLDMDAQSD